MAQRAMAAGVAGFAPPRRLAAVLESYRQPVDGYMRRQFDVERLPLEFRSALQYCLADDGKRIRPGVVLLACQAVGGKVRDGARAAATIELIHRASLVYDDIIDRDTMRRGKPALHVKFGQDIAIILAGMLVMRAIELVGRRPRLIALVCKALSDLGCGEVLDMRSCVDDRPGYMLMVEKKTSSLFRVGAVMGATLGGGSAAQQRALGEYGRHLGVAFQLRDDILGAAGSELATGKPVGADLLNGRPSLVCIELAARLETTVATVRQRASEGGVASLTLLREFRQAIEDVDALCRGSGLAAKAALGALPRSVHRARLKALVDLAVERRS